MFELADRLVGIYKTNDATKSVTIDPRHFEESCAGTKIKGKQKHLLDGESVESPQSEVAQQAKRALADVTNIQAVST